MNRNISREADKFIKTQRAKTFLDENCAENASESSSLRKRNGVERKGQKCISIRHYYKNRFNKIVSSKLIDLLVATLSTSRSHRQRVISEFMLNNMCDMVGERFFIHQPKTMAQRLMVLISDQISGWLAGRVEEADRQLEN